MIHPRSVDGFRRFLFTISMQIQVAFHYLCEVLSKKITPQRAIETLRRLRRFRAQQKSVKFVRMPDGVRIGLYTPTFPSVAFYRAAESMCGDPRRLTPITVVISISKKCCYSCEYCYQKRDEDTELPLEILTNRVQELQDRGVAIFILEGGEPFLSFERLLSVMNCIDSRSEIWINTTGAGVTRERIIAIKKAGVTALKISLHHHSPEGHNRFLGSPDGWKCMETAIDLCNEFKLPFTLNCALAPSGFFDGSLQPLLELGKKFGARYLQALTPRTAGGNAGGCVISCSDSELARVGVEITRINRSENMRDYPGLFSDEYDERMILGCTAGTGRLYLTASGELQPCQHINISFGNVQTKSLDSMLDEMRDYFIGPVKSTACTTLSGIIAEGAAAGKSFPLPIEHVREQVCSSCASRKNMECAGE